MPAYAGLGEVGAHGVDASEAGVEPAVAAYQLSIFDPLSAPALLGSSLRRSLSASLLFLSFSACHRNLDAFLEQALQG